MNARSVVSDLSNGTIYLWYSSLEVSNWRSFLTLLSNEERRRAKCFAYERDTRRFVVSHTILRMLLSEMTTIPASRLRLSTGRNSKPALLEELHQPIHFSLARSEEHVVIGFSSHPLGVDIESLSISIDVEDFASVALADEEREALNAIDLVNRHEAVLRCWTQKEAYLKAIGVGLYTSPKTIEVSFTPGVPAGLKKASGSSIRVSKWFVDIVSIDPSYVAAVAAIGAGRHIEIIGFDESLFGRLS